MGLDLYAHRAKPAATFPLKPYTLIPLNPKPYTLIPKPESLIPKPLSLNPKPYILIPIP